MNDLHTLTAELAEAQADLTLFQRLTKAEGRVKQLTSDHAKAKAAHDREAAKEAALASQARFTGLSDIRVTVSGNEPSLMHKSFAITWSAPAYDAWRGSYVKQHTCKGFAGLPAKVCAFLVERHPESIPAPRPPQKRWELQRRSTGLGDTGLPTPFERRIGLSGREDPPSAPECPLWVERYGNGRHL